MTCVGLLRPVTTNAFPKQAFILLRKRFLRRYYASSWHTLIKMPHFNPHPYRSWHALQRNVSTMVVGQALPVSSDFSASQDIAPGMVGVITVPTGTHQSSGSSSGLSPGAIAGIVVGSVVGAALLITAVALLVLYIKQKRCVWVLLVVKSLGMCTSCVLASVVHGRCLLVSLVGFFVCANPHATHCA